MGECRIDAPGKTAGRGEGKCPENVVRSRCLESGEDERKLTTGNVRVYTSYFAFLIDPHHVIVLLTGVPYVPP